MSSTCLAIHRDARRSLLAFGILLVGLLAAGCGSSGGSRPSTDGEDGSLHIVEDDTYQTVGEEGGPFDPPSADYTLRNTSGQAVDWTTNLTESWLAVAPTSGQLDPGQEVTLTVSVSMASGGAGDMPPGLYSGEVEVFETGAGLADQIPAILYVLAANQEQFPYFEKPGGSLDYMGVMITRASPSQTVWAPGSPSQEYPGGWVTPGDYLVELNAPRIHHYERTTGNEGNGDGTLTGLIRPLDNIMGRVVSRTPDDAGWINRGMEDEPDVRPQNWGSGTTVTLAAGDTLHVSYGREPWEGYKRSGSDGIVVHCVASEPEYRCGLWGTEQKTYDTDIWAGLIAFVNAAAPSYTVNTSGYGYGVQPVPSPMASDFGQRTGVDDNYQSVEVGRWVLNRAFEKIQDGAGWTGSEDDLERLFEFACNNPQQCYEWGNASNYHYQHAHGIHWYAETKMMAMMDILVGAVALGKTPDYEPLHNRLAAWAQQLDMWTSYGNYYVNSNIGSNPLAGNQDTDGHTQWLWYDLGLTDYTHWGGHQACMWSLCQWARELLQMPDTPGTADGLHHSGWNDDEDAPGGADGGRYGHPWHPTGAGGGWTGYTRYELEGTITAWLFNHHRQSQIARYSRRHYYMWSTSADADSPRWWMQYAKSIYVGEPQNLAATIDGSEVDLAWDAVSGADHYVVYRGTSDPDESPYTEMAVLDDDVPTNSYTDTTGSSGMTYYYAVSAVDYDGNDGSTSDRDTETIQ